MSDFLVPAYHGAVTAALKTLPWVLHADTYPEERTAFTVPAVFFSVPGWSRTDDISGRMAIELELDFFVVCDQLKTRENPEPEIYARSAAMDLSIWLQGNTFGQTDVEALEFVDCNRDAFDPEMDDYVVFRLTATQKIVVGEDPYAPSGNAPLTEVWLGRVPEVGRAHIDDYQLIYRRPPED